MSIKYKFILAILSIVFLVVGLFTYSSIKEQKRILNFELEKRVKLMQNNLIQNATYTMAYYKNEIENDLASMNISHIQILFTQLVKRENIDGISLSNNLQSVHIFEGIASKKDVNKLSFEETQTHIIVSSPITLSSKWGNLNILYSLKELNDEIENAQKDIQNFIDERIRDAFFSAVLFSILFGALSYTLAIKITTPILLLTKRADQIANGKLEDTKEILHINSNDEVGLLTKSFMQMSQKLQKSYNELKTLNETLEKKVQERTHELQLLAVTDPLTQLYNRRYFTSASNDVLSIAKRKQENLSLIMIDIDKFKNINDTYGHKIGDDVLMEFANILKNTQRKSDITCRFGGEEFVILLPTTDIEAATKVAQKLRTKTENFSIALKNNKSVKCTISLGVSCVDLENEVNIELALQRADNALYEAKNGGRNCVRIK
ncbi:MAG: diguanylate cyclase (GGDEF)-like protein [Sulfurimonas sp.]|jgi:diguanylate cyclase (GGDEF)-like protein|uniref:sensor domain-containing diguanylate cyclase n=1 Tax=Sulfurimonas sp. TaxID=2022749 RepID=UPI0039E58F37